MNSEIFIEAGRLADSGKGFCLAIVTATKGSTPRKAGTMMLVRADGSSIGTVGGGGAEAVAHKEALKALQDGQPRRRKYALEEDAEGIPTGSVCGGEIEIFFAPTLPHDVLYLFGAGHVGKATATIAAQAGFRVELFDNRPELKAVDGNGQLHDTAIVNYDQAGQLIPDGNQNYVVITTFAHESDEIVLQQMLGRKICYLGMMGSQAKVAAIMYNLQNLGYSEKQLSQVHAPVGLTIYSHTPAEIAVSIAAEIIQEKNRPNSFISSSFR